jgi:protein gp37
LEFFAAGKPRRAINSAANACSEPPDNDFAWNAGWPLPNVWMGVSCEGQQTADERIPLLLQMPAAVRFVSLEPLLGSIDLTDIVTRGGGCEVHRDALYCDVDSVDDEDWGGRSLDWVIVGGESGPKARPMNPDWARSIRDQCQLADVPFFFKQWGEYRPALKGGDGDGVSIPFGVNGPMMFKVGKKRAGRELDGRTWDEMPEAAR